MRKLFFLIAILLISFAAVAQQLMQNDLRQINVDKLSDEEIVYYYSRLQQAGVSVEQAAQIAASKGMPREEIEKLQKRVLALSSGQKSIAAPNNSADTSGYGRKQNDNTIKEAANTYNKRIFGADIFNNTSLSFEPNLRLATPANYVLGPDDELTINVYGLSETRYNLRINTEGSIYIPNAGPIAVAGLSVEEASAKIKARLAATIYKAIASGGTKIQVALGNIRSIKVTIIGQAKKPGTYTVSSLATVFNALYACGGPDDNGSFRKISLIRNNKIISTIDLYSFLLNGSLQGNLRLMDQDVIRIPYYDARVIVGGEAKRPGIFEIMSGETLQKVLEAAGGFTDSAYKSAVKITRLTDKEKSVADVQQNNFGTFLLNGGDSINIGKVLSRYANRIQINGAVMRPGDYALSENMTLKQLIIAADGLREDAFLNRGIITRLQNNLTPQIISFNTGAIMAGTETDIVLQKEDVITITPITDLHENYTFSIQGEIRTPGVYTFKDSTSIKDLIYQAGGFTEAATGKRIEIARRVTDASINSASTEIAKIVQIDTDKDLLKNDENFYLQPFDVVIVRNNPGYFTQRTVIVQGEVMYPGAYVINSNDEKLSDIITRAGGIKNTAYPAGASLKRLNLIDAQTEIKASKVEKLVSSQIKDSTNADSLSKESVKPYDLIGIDLNEVMKSPGITNDLILENGDLIFVPKKNQAVKVRGEVLFPTQFAFEENKNMKYYVSKAGGYSSSAVREKAFVLGANGSARKVKTFLFFTTYPKINAGDEIFIPRIPDRKNRLSTTEIISISSTIASLAAVAIALINSLK
ncbi:SLBB domain-containing protein [Limnovirga soli]|uniref:Capsule biosynthesis protein n=1 Tax=Limnovirga soli TaxID=2656915 RepID=A0A8J8JR61_9BACT|nr:SLBB domain-containing protein [Limnovirga soli]NNV55517.1 capsule biosynthesis protein [Limnovirga soli]